MLLPLAAVVEFYTYMEVYWVTHRRAHLTVFAIDDHRTNNDIEGWHRHLNDFMTAHPNIWSFINHMRVEYITSGISNILKKKHICRKLCGC